MDEELPWHSTVSLPCQLFPAAVFERLFDHIFARCVARGLVAGYKQAVDSAPVKANASLETVLGKLPAGTSGTFLATSESASPAAPWGDGPVPPAANLKKLLKHRPNRQVSLTVALPQPLLAANRRAGRQSRSTEAPTRALAKPLPGNRTA